MRYLHILPLVVRCFLILSCSVFLLCVFSLFYICNKCHYFFHSRSDVLSSLLIALNRVKLLSFLLVVMPEEKRS